MRLCDLRDQREVPPARVPELLADELVALARRCRAALPELHRQLRIAHADLRALAGADRVVRLQARQRLDDARADVELAETGAIEALTWAAELMQGVTCASA